MVTLFYKHNRNVLLCIYVWRLANPNLLHGLGSVIAQAVSHLSLTTEAQVSPYRICRGQSGIKTDFSEIFGF
jgi:hypothetical protein